MIKNLISVQIIADSVNDFGQRITSAILTYPRIVHAELMTHRALSRNAASSRAIPSLKMIANVTNEPFIPVKFQKAHSGMQGSEYCDERETQEAVLMWLEARDSALLHAQKMLDAGITKQIVNRILEPYQYYTSLVTGTELENFFALRAQDAAEIHFQDLAYKMLDAMNQSEPRKLKAGEWHIPFGDNIDETILRQLLSDWSIEDIDRTLPDQKIKIATVRAARISYVTPDSEQKIDYEADLKLHDRLAASGHWSAFEHCARAMSEGEMNTYTIRDKNRDLQLGWCGNFRGFIQYRKMFADENRSDLRLIKK